MARYVRLPDEPEVAEAAVTVIDESQRRGLGTLLLEALGAVALENGIVRFLGYVLTENRALRELVRKEGVPLGYDSPGLLRAEVDLPKRAEDLKGTPLYRLFRALARGEPEWAIRLREFWVRLSGDVGTRGP